MNEIGLRLLEWHKDIDRDLPWKETEDPYFIWLSEIILQQTRVAQGLPYYNKFINLFPTVFDLAKATEEVVFKAWEGLGYYSRARNLHTSAKYIVEELNGKFPETYDDILKLKGVGPYTAAAISSFAFGENKAVLDGNVFRVLSRIFDIDTDILSSAGKKEFEILANDLLITGKAALYNQAIMDFGALLCTPKNPDCFHCPIQQKCLAFANNSVGSRPVKKKAKKKKKRYFHYLVYFGKDHHTILKKRSESDIWQGLHEFPLKELSSSKRMPIKDWHNEIGLDLSHIDVSHFEIKQTLSHQLITAIFYIVKPNISIQGVQENLHRYTKTKNSDYFYIEINQLNSYAFPKIINSFLETVPFL